MGLLNFLFGSKNPQVGEMVIGAAETKHDTSDHVRILSFLNSKEKSNTLQRRVCRVESLEERQMLAADPIDFGAVYHETSPDNDLQGDVFHVTWEGGDAGTQLEKVVISLDKVTMKRDINGNLVLDENGNPMIASSGNGKYDPGEVIFHDGTTGQFGYADSQPFEYDESQSVKLDLAKGNGKGYEISADQLTLTIYFDNFTAGSEFIFSIDVDEIDEVSEDGKTIYAGNAVVDGAELQRSVITGTFAHQNYHDTDVAAVYMDVFSNAKSEALGLPNDAYNRLGQTGYNDLESTAGAFASMEQTPLPIAISGNVYVDKNDNHQIDNGEGINDVWLQLWVKNDAGNYEYTGLRVQTGANGAYTFSDPSILPGNYQIREEQPLGYGSVSTEAGNVSGQTRGVIQNLNDISAIFDSSVVSNINLVGGENSVKNDFIETLGSLNGYVYEDDDDDGIKDDGEEGIGSVTLELFIWNKTENKYVSTGRTCVTLSSPDGNGHGKGYYSFDNLMEGEYEIRELVPVDFAYIDGTDTPGTLGGVTNASLNDIITQVHIGGGETGTDYNFGELKPSTLSGRVAIDTNNDGVLDENDLRLKGVTVQLLDANGNLISSTTTDDDGNYLFNNIEPNTTYQVRELQPLGFNVVNNTRVAVYDLKDLQETKNTLYDGADVVGRIRKIEATTDGTIIGSLVAPDTITTIVFAKAGSEGYHYDFLEKQGGCIEGFVYSDSNGNGSMDNGETGIDGVTITLRDATGAIIATFITGAEGYTAGQYRFCGLDPDKVYTVTETQPPSWCDGMESKGKVDDIDRGDISVNDVISQIPVMPGAKGTGFNFGEWEYATLGGYVYEDLDNDGLKESGENGITNVEVQLWVWDDTTSSYKKTDRESAYTDANGHYIFSNVCPFKKFRVVEVQPNGYNSGENTAGSPGDGTASNPNDWITDIELTPGTNSQNNNFGELQEASISGTVFADVTLNNGKTDTTKTDNGVQDNGEVGIAKVTVKLYVQDTSGTYSHGGNKWRLVDTTETDSSGNYSFDNLLPGTYLILEEQPDGYFDGIDTVGSLSGTLDHDDDTGTDWITSIVVSSGDHGTGYNLGELTPGKISGFVFQDGDTIVYKESAGKPNVEDVRNGIKKTTDMPLVGVKLVLCEANGTPVRDEDGNLITTVTDKNGFYAFTGLAPENYGVREIQPSDYEEGINVSGTKGGYAQCPGNALTASQLTLLAGNDPSNLIFMINVNYGENAANNNFSEVLFQLQEDPPNIPPPPNRTIDYPGPPQGALGGPGNTNNVFYTPPIGVSTWTPGMGGGGIPSTYTWHLSVINAGYPRSLLDDTNLAYGYRAQALYTTVAWQAYDMGQTQWALYNGKGQVTQAYSFGPGYGTPVAGDFNGDGIAEIAIYCDGLWYIDLNGNGSWDDDDLWAKLGSATDQPVVGDWDGDGKIDIGVFGPEWSGDVNALDHEPGLPADLNQKVSLRPKNLPPNSQDASSAVRALKHTTRGRVRLDVVDHVFRYGSESDRAITGDFNGDGVSEIGVYRNGTWYIDYNGSGQWDVGDIETHTGGSQGDIPIVGDFNGNEKAQIGLYTPSTGRVTIDNNADFKLDESDRIFYLEGIDDIEAIPVVGDFNGDGIDEIVMVKHLQRIPLQTRVIPSTPSLPTIPSPQLAPVVPSVSSEYISPGHVMPAIPQSSHPSTQPSSSPQLNGPAHSIDLSATSSEIYYNNVPTKLF